MRDLQRGGEPLTPEETGLDMASFPEARGAAEGDDDGRLHPPRHDRRRRAPDPRRLEECLQTGSAWVHLRLCLACGHVGCCDSSPNTHATKHFHTTEHPLVQSFQPGEDRVWCYVDEVLMEPV